MPNCKRRATLNPTILDGKNEKNQMHHKLKIVTVSYQVTRSRAARGLVLSCLFLIGYGGSLAAQPFAITDAYDKFRDISTATLNPLPIRGTSIRLSVAIATRGKAYGAPDLIHVMLLSSSESWQFLRCRSVTFLADGMRIQATKIEHNGSVLGSGGVIENVSFGLTADQFWQLAQAKEVEGQLCTTEFRLWPEHRAGLLELTSRFTR